METEASTQSRIRSLQPVLREWIEASSHIASLGACVRELVLNSVDARCQHVNVRLSFSPLSIDVQDDGKGMSLEELSSLGEKISPYIHDSKKCYGFWGRALHCIVVLAESVTVTSRLQATQTVYQKTFNKGKSVGVSTCKPLFPFGTSISIQGLFYCLPVRLKQTNAVAEMLSLKKFLQHLSLIQYHVIFTLECAAYNTIFCTSLAPSSTIAICRHTASKIDVILHQKDFFAINLHSEIFSIEGKAALRMVQRRPPQFIFINKCPVLQTRMHTLITKAVMSFLSKQEIDGASHFPVFYLNIECDRSEYNFVSDMLNSEAEFKRQREVTELLLKVADLIVQQIQCYNVKTLPSGGSDKLDCQSVPSKKNNKGVMLLRDTQLGQPAVRIRAPSVSSDDMLTSCRHPSMSTLHVGRKSPSSFLHIAPSTPLEQGEH